MSERAICTHGCTGVGAATLELLERVTIEADVCHGRPCIRGTRVLVTVLFDALAAGMSTDEIVDHYPTTAPEDIRAAAAYDAWLSKQEIHALSVS